MVDAEVETRSSARVLARVGVAVLMSDAIFQLGLAAGMPWGAAAWGGRYVHPPAELRWASVGAVAVLSVVALALLRGAGFAVPAVVPRRWLGSVLWVVTGLLTLNALANAASVSQWERWLMTPMALVLAVCTATVARFTVRRNRAEHGRN